MKQTLVIATFSVIGYHRWEDAPAEVLYLSSQHRHEFKYRVEVQVGHNDRAVEFHMLKRACITVLQSRYEVINGEFMFGKRSCEMLAHDLYDLMSMGGVYPSAIEVWEDGENGARVSFERPSL